MTVRKLFPLAVAAGLWIAGPAMAQNTVQLTKENQKLADAVATKLKASGVVKSGDKIDIRTENGTVVLLGSVSSPERNMEIQKVVQSVSGVKRVESTMAVAGMMPEMAPVRMPELPTITRANELMPVQAPIALPPAGPGAGPAEPLPLNGMPAMAPIDPAGPKLPPYAWPTYAPYNNMSRVAYPASYPYNAFPYIGPYYPFPKVPLGWRKVVLEWEDGHWYLGRMQNPADYWRVKFW